MSVRIESQAEPIPGYKLLDRLGSGGFGEVWRAEAPGGIFKAIKIIHGDLRSRDNDLIRYAEQELKALKRVQLVRHPYLLALDRYDIVDGRLMIVMELADCNLWDRFRACRDKGLPGIPRDELMMYMAETAEVLDLMNDQHQLQHLDIKPQNLFMLHNHVKVADFGQVKDLQGVMASVTGGITPVYAAPETFDGVVTRFCDQYSLACVYQELLTGVRPFDGSSMSQLLMQHIQLPPNLQPSPAHDRDALNRALSKKPDDRWPNVCGFVRSLREGGSRTSVPVSSDLAAIHARGETHLASAKEDGSETPMPRSVLETTPPLFTPAPPEVAGEGPLQPTLIIGIGQSGLRVIQRFRYELEERFGSVLHTPSIRSIYIDTDPDTIDDAKVARPLERLAALRFEDVIESRINRAAHYMKPRLNGRSLIEGWFDPQLLYKIPRNPTSMGTRLFGRLAFCDHYRAIMGKVQSELDSALASESLEATMAQTGLDCRTNRPRVFIVAGLGGGTGGGMFLDMAFAIRYRLKRMGYEVPDVTGLFLVPPADTSLSTSQMLGNTYAALTELNHYSRPETIFTGNYDERNASIREKAPPFSRFYLLPGTVAGNTVRTTPPGHGSGPQAALRRSGTVSLNIQRTPGGISPPTTRTSGAIPGAARNRMPSLTPTSIPVPGSRALSSGERPVDAAAGLSALKPFTDAAEFLRLNLFTPVGRRADEFRAREENEPKAKTVNVSAFGLVVFDWPRGDIVARTAIPVARNLLKAWVGPNPKRAREVIPTWAAEHWARYGLDPDTLLCEFQKAAEDVLGCRVDELLSSATEGLVPKGWLARLPEPERVALALDKLVRTFGAPASGATRTLTPVEEAIQQAAVVIAQNAANELSLIGPALVEDPEFRLGGTEDVLRQFLATIDRLLALYSTQAADMDAKSLAAHSLLLEYGHYHRGARKPSTTEFGEAVRAFPRCRFQAITFNCLLELYQYLRDHLMVHLQEIGACRQRAEAAIETIVPAVPDEMIEVAATVRRLMPPGCLTIANAVERYLGVMTPADYQEIDRRVQIILEAELGGVFQTCLNSANGATQIATLIEQEARSHLDTRLGSVDLATMFNERYRTPQATELVISEAYQQAEPSWIGSGPWSSSEVAVLASPGGEAGEGLREIARRGIPVAGLPTADTRDELTIYREFPNVPLAALPHLGPAGATAYQTLPETNQCALHARLDVTHWTEIDAD